MDEVMYQLEDAQGLYEEVMRALSWLKSYLKQDGMTPEEILLALTDFLKVRPRVFI